MARRDEKAQAMHVPSSMLAIVSEPGHPAPLLWVGRNYVDAGSAARGGFSSLVLYGSRTTEYVVRLWHFLVSTKAKLEIFSFSRPLTGAPCAT